MDSAACCEFEAEVIAWENNGQHHGGRRIKSNQNIGDLLSARRLWGKTASATAGERETQSGLPDPARTLQGD